MKKLLNLFILAAVGMNIIAQAPQGFNYQAVARNENGEILSSQNLKVRIAIINGTSLMWQEDHLVETNGQGLFSLIIGGNDNGKTGGSAESFGDIPWGDGTFSINVSVDAGSGFISMGNAPLMSVPYALYANSGGGGSPGDWSQTGDTLYTQGSVGIGTIYPHKSLLAIQSSDPQVEKPIFEVRNDLGNPVFAVFNDGVQVYVDEQRKGVKGGFAVGGYTSGKKGPVQPFLHVSPDSVRIFVPDDPATKVGKGGFAVGGYSTAGKGITNNYLEVTRRNTNIFFDTISDGKGPKGGFAVGGYNSAKAGESDQIMSLTASNYLIGQKAGLNITTGRDNTFFGWQAGLNNTTGNENIFIGKFSGYSNTGGNTNIFMGNYAGASTLTGNNNVMLGDSAGYSNTFGFNNVFLGRQAGLNNKNGGYNIFMGYRSGASHVDGISNIYIGDEAGSMNDTSSNQVFIGDWAGAFAETDDNNILIGGQAGIYSDLLEFNTFLGSYSGAYAKGNKNTFLGAFSGFNTDGNENVLLGVSAGLGSAEGFTYDHNTYVGSYTGYYNTSGSDNVFLGYMAGYNNSSGTGNVYLGYQAGANETTASNQLIIANNDTDLPLIRGNFANTTLDFSGNIGINYDALPGYGMIIDVPATQNYLFTVVAFGDYYASGSYYVPDGPLYKNAIGDITDAVRKISSLNGIYYDQDVQAKDQDVVQKRTGLIADEVEKEFPGLVKKGLEGNKAINYDGLVPVLVEAIKEQQAQIEQQQAEIEALKTLIESISR